MRQPRRWCCAGPSVLGGGKRGPKGAGTSSTALPTLLDGENGKLASSVSQHDEFGVDITDAGHLFCRDNSSNATADEDLDLISSASNAEKVDQILSARLSHVSHLLASQGLQPGAGSKSAESGMKGTSTKLQQFARRLSGMLGHQSSAIIAKSMPGRASSTHSGLLCGEVAGETARGFELYPDTRPEVEGIAQVSPALDPSFFHIRQKGYTKTKKKEPSGSPLYVLLPGGYEGIMPVNKILVDLPQQHSDKWPKHPKYREAFAVPYVLVCHISIPKTSPSVLTKTYPMDDNGWNGLTYYTLAPDVLDVLEVEYQEYAKRTADGMNRAAREDFLVSTVLFPSGLTDLQLHKLKHVRHWRKLLRAGESVRSLPLKWLWTFCPESLKGMEMDGFPKFLVGYAGKPILLTKSTQLRPLEGNLASQCRVLEIYVDTRKFSSMFCATTKMAWEYVASTDGRHARLAFLVEAKDDDLLPERLLFYMGIKNFRPNLHGKKIYVK
ncbi:unnamed protein product [Amoebophrya sp. A120]|nr:unnamed protein product [Amoebophrya sp. A120]|eukprot:GSA120T00015347001.1